MVSKFYTTQQIDLATAEQVVSEKKFAELERIVVIKPAISDQDFVPMLNYHMKYHNLNWFNDILKLQVQDKQRQMTGLLSNVFKRAVLAKTCAFLSRDIFGYTDWARNYATKKSEELMKQGNTLMDSIDYSSVYDLVMSVGKLLYCELGKFGDEKNDGIYRGYMDAVEILCDPEKNLCKAEINFFGESIKFAVLQQEVMYDSLIGGDSYIRRLCEEYPELLSPTVGYIYVKSESYVDHIGTMVDNAVSDHSLLDNSDVTINGKKPLGVFRDMFGR